MGAEAENCLKRLEQLEEENRQLRRAAESFGLLAERLNDELQERRRAGDRRTAHRSTGDRRKRVDWAPGV